MDLADWELDDNVIHQLWVCIFALGFNLHVPSAMDRVKLAASDVLLCDLPGYNVYLHLCESIPSPGGYPLRYLDFDLNSHLPYRPLSQSQRWQT